MFEAAYHLRSEESSEIDSNAPAISIPSSVTDHEIYSLALSSRSHHIRADSGLGLVGTEGCAHTCMFCTA